MTTRRTIGRISERIDALASRRWPARFRFDNLSEEAEARLDEAHEFLKQQRLDEQPELRTSTRDLSQMPDEELIREFFKFGLLTPDDFKPD